jgi:signal transduction histidine kinase
MSSDENMEAEDIGLRLKVRADKRLHYSIVVITSLVILAIYYFYTLSLPTPPGHYMDWFWSIFCFEYQHDILGIVLLVPILYSTITLGWKRSAVLLLILAISVTPYVIEFSYTANALVMSFSSLILPSILLMSIQIKLISDAKVRLAEAEKKRERAEFIRQLFITQEDERKRISLELHDGVTQTLLVNASLAHNILENNNIENQSMKADLEAIKNNSLNMVAEIRCICQDLRPSVLDNLGLVSSIKWLVDNFHEETGVNVDFSLIGSAYELSQDESVALFRMIQEAFNNIKKHAEARVVNVSIGFQKAGLSIQIRDDGKGFELTNNKNQLALNGKLGILGMNERAQSIGATLQIKSAKDWGTEVTIVLQKKKEAKKPQRGTHEVKQVATVRV